jgi:hypothetical protein
MSKNVLPLILRFTNPAFADNTFLRVYAAERDARGFLA